MPHVTLLLWSFPLKFYFTYWVFFYFQHHLFCFSSILSFTWTWFSYLMSLTHLTQILFLFFFALFELFEHGYNNFESLVFMIFQVIFIAMGVLIIGGDMLSWVFILFTLKFVHVGGLGWWSRDYFHLNQELANLWKYGKGSRGQWPLTCKHYKLDEQGRVGPLSVAQQTFPHLKWKLGRWRSAGEVSLSRFSEVSFLLIISVYVSYKCVMFSFAVIYFSVF